MAHATADRSSHATAGTVYEILPKGGVATTGGVYNPATTAVNANPVTAISLPATLALTVGNVKVISPTITPTNVPNTVVAYVSGTPAKATVKVNNLNQCEVTGVATGTSVITATSDDDNSKTATCTVTVS